MQLHHISIALLVAAAGGDPWAINKSLQVGRPVQISDLAEAFHAAGRCTTEANAAFNEARRRFDGAWNRENGDHPINDSAEVQRVVQSLGAQSLQLPKIGVDLENIAAALAEAQRSANGQIATLEGRLERLDDLIGQALDREKDVHVTAEEISELDAFVGACEEDAIKDTQAALGQIESTRNGYTDSLQKSLNNLRTEGYDPAAIHGLDSDVGPAPSGLQSGELAGIRQVTNHAVVDQMGKVRAAHDALNKALATLYTKGPGSPEGEAAAQSLPKLKADLAHALDDLGKIPDYNNIDPASVSTTLDGRFMFTYNVDGQRVQVVGQLRNGTGEFFDQATGTSYTFKDGKLTGMRTLDPGKVEATPEPLWSAITLAVGGPELKAGGEVAWQGLKTLFSREALAGLTSDNVLPRALSGAEVRAAIAEADLPPRSIPRGAGGQPVPGVHPGPPPVVEQWRQQVRAPTSWNMLPGNMCRRCPTARRRYPTSHRRRCPRITRYSMATNRSNRAQSSPEPMAASSIPTTASRSSPMRYRALSSPTLTCLQIPCSAASATPAVPTWPPMELPSRNCHSPQIALSNPTFNTS
jgi:Hydrolase N-terminal helical domain